MLTVMSSSFHAFTFERDAAKRPKCYSGPVADFDSTEGIVTFTYSYEQDGVDVAGSFTGEEAKGVVKGVWKEASNKPIAGEKSWQGSAVLHGTEVGNRILFHGVWSMRGTGRRALGHRRREVVLQRVRAVV